MTDIRDEVAMALIDSHGYPSGSFIWSPESLLAALAARGLTVVRDVGNPADESDDYHRGYRDAEAYYEPRFQYVRAERQRLYDFVADCDQDIVDAWHFGENLRLAKGGEA